MNLLHHVSDRLRAAAGADPLVKATQDGKHGDYQANCAMSLAKAQGKKPRDIAQEICDRLDLGDLFEKPDIAGPGFINLRLKNDWIAQRIQAVARDGRLGVDPAQESKTFVIDFSGPNVAKPMHVGHLRSTIIGDSIARTLRFLGHRVVGDNHLGDWGTQFGIILYGYKNFLDKAALEKDPVRELARIYVHVRKMMKGDEDDDQAGDAIGTACRLETAKLHQGDEENVRLWKQFMPWCLQEIETIYQRLDVKFDHTYGESFYNPMLAGVVADLLAKKIAEPSKGAVVIWFGENDPPALIRKTDGAFTYTTTDLATIRYRIETWKPDSLLYVVDSRQALHFKNLFDAVRRWGYGSVAMEHISFGSVLGEDKKPLKTRDGGVPELGGLLDEAVERAGQVYDENRSEGDETLSAEERQAVCEAVGLGAVKYADLCQNRTSDYIFKWDKMLAMNGNTGAYMQYAYARNRSIFRRGNIDPAKFRADPPKVLLNAPEERALALQILKLEEALTLSGAECQPSVITSYLWDLSKSFSGFFQNCPVLKAETPELRDSRLLLCDLTARVIKQCLELLGIRTVERM